MKPHFLRANPYSSTRMTDIEAFVELRRGRGSQAEKEAEMMIMWGDGATTYEIMLSTNSWRLDNIAAKLSGR